jgi:hypothetical protein
MTEKLRSIREAARELGVSTTQMLDWLSAMSGGVDLKQVSVDTPCINDGLFDQLTNIALSEFRPDPPTRRL